jgi:hypothetical protein
MPTPQGKMLKAFKPSGVHEHESFFRKRQQAVGIAWTAVNMTNMMLLYAACIEQGIGVGMYPASGGRGVCIKLYVGRKLPETEYANTAEELDYLVEGVLVKLGALVLEEEESAADD